MDDIIQGKIRGQTDWERGRRERIAGIEPEKGPDEGTFDWSKIQVTMPQPKKPISVRLDAEIIEFFKVQGKGYQTRINAVLRSYMEAHQK